MVVGLVPLANALTLATPLVVNEVGGARTATLASVVVALLLLGAWWVVPLWRRWRRPPTSGAAGR